MSNTQKVLVTGGAGFIGARVVKQLVEHGRSVRVFDNFYRSDQEVVTELQRMDGVEIHEGDVRYRSSIERAMDGIDEVVHLAAICLNKSISDPEESLEVNLRGSQHVFEAAAEHQVRRLVFASSASVYGDPETLPMVESCTLNPITPYCISKLASEQLLRFTANRSNLAWMAFRFFNVYGPGQPTDAYYTSVVLTFLRRIASGAAPVIDGTGAQSMDFVHVNDVARAVVDGLLSDHSGSVLNVGSGTQTTIAELAEMLRRIVGSDVEPQFRPRDVLVARRQADISAITALLGWKPEVNLEDGLREVVEELRARGELDAVNSSRVGAVMSSTESTGSASEIPAWHHLPENKWNPHAWVIGEPQVGTGTWIGAFAVVDASGGLEIGCGCDISAGAHIYTHSTVARAVSGGTAPIERRPTSIGDHVHIGANATILMGSSIGDHCIVGAGAVVREGTEAPAWSLLVGVPARVILGGARKSCPPGPTTRGT